MREAIVSLIKISPALAPQFVRMGFHDCVGGCDGCLDLLNKDNRGLELPIQFLSNLLEEYAVHGVTRADIWALAALTGADQTKAQPPVIFTFEWYGRPTCEMLNEPKDCVESTCSATRGPHRELPGPDLDTHGVLRYFEDTFGLDAQETVALMGAHSIGNVKRLESGFVGTGWDATPNLLDNGYFFELVGRHEMGANVSLAYTNSLNWRHIFINNTNVLEFPDRHQWSFGRVADGDENNLVMLNADIALVRDFSGKMGPDGKVDCAFKIGTSLSPSLCPIAVETFDHVLNYKTNGRVWLEDFRDVFEYMLEFPFKAANTTCLPVGEVCHILH